MKRSTSDSEGSMCIEEQEPEQVAAPSKTKQKACTQCGTTRTPQWREGPAGPKTLCNACGVKRVRLLKKDRENAACKAKKAAAAAAKVDSPPGPQSGHGYQLRQQPAVAALLKAAHMAHLTGPSELRSQQPSDSAQEESGDGEESSWALGRLEALQGMGPEGLAAVNLLSMSYSGDISPLPSPTRLRLRCLDQQQQPPAAHVPALKLEPAEVKVEPPPLSITPPPTAAQAQPSPPSPPPAAIATTTTTTTTGPACHATVTTTSPGTRATSPTHGQPADITEAAAATTTPAIATATAAGAATTAPATTAATAAASDALRSFFDRGMCSALEQAPTHKLMRLMELRDQVEAAQREAAAADAAVSSVARVLAMKQAAAIRAKTAAAEAARQLQCMLVDWDREAAAGQVLSAKKIRLFR